MNKAKALMAKRDWSVSDLQFEARVSRNTAYKVATFEVWPDRHAPYETIERIADALDVSPADLVRDFVRNNKGSGQ